MPTFLDRPTFRDPPIVPGAIISACSLAYVLSRSVLAALPERFGRRVFLVLPGLAGGTAVIAGILSGSFWMAAGGYVVGSLLWSAEYPSMLGVLAVGGKRSFAPAMALMQAASYLLSALAIYATGAAVQHAGPHAMAQAMVLPAGGFLLVGVGGAVWVLANRGRWAVDGRR